jgi:hypothetical protein
MTTFSPPPKINEWANGRMGEWANGRMGEWANGRMGEWVNGPGETTVRYSFAPLVPE